MMPEHLQYLILFLQWRVRSSNWDLPFKVRLAGFPLHVNASRFTTNDDVFRHYDLVMGFDVHHKSPTFKVDEGTLLNSGVCLPDEYSTGVSIIDGVSLEVAFEDV